MWACVCVRGVWVNTGWVAAAGLTGGRINHFNITKQVGAGGVGVGVC